MKYFVVMQITNVARISSSALPPCDQFAIQPDHAVIYCAYQTVVRGNYLPRKGELQPIEDRFGKTHLFRVSEVVHTDIPNQPQQLHSNGCAIVILNMWGHREAFTSGLRIDNWSSEVFDGLGTIHAQFRTFSLMFKSMNKKPVGWIDTDDVAMSSLPSMITAPKKY